MHELDEAGLAENALRTLARDSGGEFYREEDLNKLAEKVQPKTTSIQVRKKKCCGTTGS